MKVKTFLYIGGLLFLGLLLGGCKVERLKKQEGEDIPFTVVEKEEIPEELMEQIKMQKEAPFRLTFGDGEWMYIARGYGKQKTAGCSVQVIAVRENEEGIYVETTLLGPENELEWETTSIPYVVIKMENRDALVFIDE